ncbi:hypothetical protein GM658_18400 [Pseudoduganella eburnea]|uniref:DUF7709 domain-containing protein n=2 Tax=Massilia eburnea TaxID=1776165 RepID=A0A6L6QKH7_9BURK|nr:hypothetical protein [Massilia eburnea]
MHEKRCDYASHISFKGATMDDLASINQKILADGESLPLVQLKDGSKVQTGTVATMLRNIALYNAGERGDIERQLEAAIPTVAKVGLFDLFPPEEWIAGSNEGRRLVGMLAARHLALK